MYQPGGARAGLAGRLTVTAPSSATVNATSTSRCSMSEEWVVAPGRIKEIDTSGRSASTVPATVPPYPAAVDDSVSTGRLPRNR